jgi:hypothetical protein
MAGNRKESDEVSSVQRYKKFISLPNVSVRKMN